MKHQVLARKYRPANFEELEGQEHVLQALINALDNERLHHAYLFTGTRGVGKTTIARILAKCLSCEKGITAKPCGECTTCLEIAEGRSVDLIEVDAASRTKVEDTRELLANVQYAPTRNRFKVYLIDEVHMLSTHSFNALLKTLEEPPEHVKFLLATTDPKKLPVTVLSRCLQFNLKNLSPERVVTYLKKILPAEGVEFEEPALWQLGRAADGSMRDALSLTDQAIAFGNNSVSDDAVKTMLGAIDQGEVFALLNALVTRDAAAILDKIQALSEFAPDYPALLADMLSILHRVAVAQAVPDAVDNSQGDKDMILALADAMSREDVQLYYQIALVGRRDLGAVPDQRGGFEMVLLRMLTFEPFTQDEMGAAGPATEKKTVEFAAGPLDSLLSRPKEGTAKPTLVSHSTSTSNPTSTSTSNPESIAAQDSASPLATSAPPAAPAPALTPAPATAPAESVVASPVEVSEIQQVAGEVAAVDEGFGGICAASWHDVLAELGLSAVTLSVASNCVVASCTEAQLELVLDSGHSSMLNPTHEQRIAKALNECKKWHGKVTIKPGKPHCPTPAQIDQEKRNKAHREAVALINNDSNVRVLIESFDGELNLDSIVARDPGASSSRQ